MLAKMWRKGITRSLLMGIENGAAILETGAAVS
jgi:hypothetical protein